MAWQNSSDSAAIPAHWMPYSMPNRALSPNFVACQASNIAPRHSKTPRIWQPFQHVRPHTRHRIVPCFSYFVAASSGCDHCARKRNKTLLLKKWEVHSLHECLHYASEYSNFIQLYSSRQPEAPLMYFSTVLYDFPFSSQISEVGSESSWYKFCDIVMWILWYSDIVSDSVVGCANWKLYGHMWAASPWILLAYRKASGTSGSGCRPPSYFS